MNEMVKRGLDTFNMGVVGVGGNAGVRGLPEALVAALGREGVVLNDTELHLFAVRVQESVDAREQAEYDARGVHGGCGVHGASGAHDLSLRGLHDMLGLIREAVAAGRRDEAIWRASLAVHFGRERFECAAGLLCAFTGRPVWTWERVRGNPDALYGWLIDNRESVGALKFGHHRKYESAKPEQLWGVIESFIEFTGGHPSRAFAGEGETPEDRFHGLYRATAVLRRFGRTARFDLLCLLKDMNLADIRPGSCYLAGATGPLRGARKLWGNRPVAELDALAVALARELGLTPEIMEDALCNWQK